MEWGGLLFERRPYFFMDENGINCIRLESPENKKALSATVLFFRNPLKDDVARAIPFGQRLLL